MFVIVIGLVSAAQARDLKGILPQNKQSFVKKRCQIFDLDTILYLPYYV